MSILSCAALFRRPNCLGQAILWLLLGGLVAAAASPHRTRVWGQENPPSASAPLASTGGTIEGTVRYQADPSRPWRYVRYYVKRLSSGELAEAVVALRAVRGSSLTAASEAGRVPQTVVIDQKDFTFQPETIVLRRGDAVRFTNSDGATHNVQADSPIASFNITMPGGGAHTVTFERAGGTRWPVQVGCVFHSAMRAWIFVFDHPYYQLTGSDGRFRLSQVPPGDYELEVVHPAGELATRQRVTVRAGQTLQLDIRLAPADKR